jgi:acetyltransferase-like isoleucine patch superfamily enzyme
MWRLRLIGSMLVAILPGWLKRPIYRHVYGYRIGKRVSIGFGVVFFGVPNCQLEDDVRIRPFNVFWRTGRLSIGEHARIGPFNLFRGGTVISIGPFVTILRTNVFNSILDPDLVNVPEPILQLGPGSVVTTGHWLDFTDRITLGPHSIVGGRHSSFWTHSRQRTRPITIGAHCYLGSEARVAPGVEVPCLCVVALGSVLIGRIEQERSLVGGNPATCLRMLTESELAGAVRKTRNDIPDGLVSASLPDDLRPEASRTQRPLSEISA